MGVQPTRRPAPGNHAASIPMLERPPEPTGDLPGVPTTTDRLAVALEGLQEALRQRKATPAEIARAADTGGVGTVIRPYLEALTANG